MQREVERREEWRPDIRQLTDVLQCNFHEYLISKLAGNADCNTGRKRDVAVRDQASVRSFPI
jgi:hypothetical protein